MRRRAVFAAVVMKVFTCGLAVALVAAGSTSQAEVVFGNLGPSGTDSFSTFTQDYGPTVTGNEGLASGFNTGSSTELTLQSITLGLFASDSVLVPLSVTVYTDVSGAPGTVAAISAPVNVGSTGAYDFSFSSVVLSANTTYWAVPSSGNDTAWYLAGVGSSFVAPTEQNASGYSAVGALKDTGSATWVAADASEYAISVNAVVPEPTTIALAFCGAGIAAFGFTRRWLGR